MSLRFLVPLFLGINLWGSASAQTEFARVRAALPKVLVQGKIRFFYDTQGAHAVQTADANGNGVPDQVEDIATQMTGAWSLLIEGLGFPDPFSGERYRGVDFLDVHLLSKTLLNSNGLTYDEIQRFHRPGDPNGLRSLCVDIATSTLAPENLTPAHEVFHVIQNGATYFKTRWFTEGTARWSEAALGPGGTGGKRSGLRASWPPSEASLKAIFEMSYEASPQFWEPLALALDRTGKIPQQASQKVADMRYTNGEPVLKDLDLNGWQIIRDVLVELGKADDRAFTELGLEKWTEDAQKSVKNSPYIHAALMKVAGR